jgi:hypothetical protein
MSELKLNDYEYDPFHVWAKSERADDGSLLFFCAKCDQQFTDWDAFHEHALTCQSGESATA